MEVEVTEPFGPQTGKRPTNFVVLKYFLLGMLISNGIESIFIVPKTLSMMDDNEEKIQKLDDIYMEHEAFKAKLSEYHRMVERRERNKYDKIGGHIKDSLNKLENATAEKNHRLRKIAIPTPSTDKDNVDTNRLVEVMLLLYGVVTMAMGIYAVFKESDKLLLAFIGVVCLGLVMLFFSGLTLLVFMAVLNDVIIALISFKYYQMLVYQCDEAYGATAAAQQYGDASVYNTVDLNAPANYR